MAKQGEAYYRYSYRELSAFLPADFPSSGISGTPGRGACHHGRGCADKRKGHAAVHGRGRGLGDPFFKVLEDTKVFPDYVVKMAKLGQSTGTMDQMMNRCPITMRRNTGSCGP